jgi:hypothetical protein
MEKVMNTVVRAIFAGGAIAWLASPVMSSESLITAPRGWSLENWVGSQSVCPTATAFAAYKYKDDVDDIYDRSLVVQTRANGESSMEFPGKVFKVEYAPSCDHLLVSRVGGDVQHGMIGTSLLGPAGDLRWATTDSRMFHFSTTGEVVYALWEGTSPYEMGSDVEVFNLNGDGLRKFSLDSPSVRGVIVPDNGSSVIFVSESFILRLGATTITPQATTTFTTQWRRVTPGRSLDATLVDSGHFRVRLEGGESGLVRIADGTWIGKQVPGPILWAE